MTLQTEPLEYLRSPFVNRCQNSQILAAKLVIPGEPYTATHRKHYNPDNCGLRPLYIESQGVGSAKVWGTLPARILTLPTSTLAAFSLEESSGLRALCPKP